MALPKGYTNAGHRELSGTSLVGYITITYTQLVAVLGEPNGGAGDKTTCEWEVKAPNGVVFTIYDWKEDATPMGLYDWHLGGHNATDVVKVVKELFPNAHRGPWAWR